MNPIKQLTAKIKQGDIAPVYMAIGDEAHGKQNFFKLLQKQLIDPSMGDFNFEQLNANDVKGVTVADKAGELPMMADRRLILVMDCGQWKKKDIEAITGYCQAPNEKTCLVLDFSTADRRRKLFQIKTGAVSYIEFQRPKSWELPDFIAGLVRDLKLNMKRDAVNMVAELAGDDISRVYRELDKLSLYRLGDQEITADDVALLLGRTRQVTRWELNDYIGSRDLAGALIKAGDIIESGEEPLGLLSSINTYLKQLFLVKSMLRGGLKDQNQIARAIGLPPRIASRLIKSQASFSDYELRSGLELVKQTDFKLKSAGMSRRLMIDALLTRLLRPGPFAPPRRQPRRA